MFYILRKNYSEEDRRAILLGLCQILRVEGIDTEKICSALQNSAFSDFEDCLQAECAMAAQVDYIISRNTDDFKLSQVPCLTAEEFCKKFI